ncbi:MAG TPA: DUF3617 family protein [Caulobacteraceae bacterium]
MRTVLIMAASAIVLTAAALGGCGKGGAGKPGSSTAGPAAGGEGASGPMRKAGLWEISRLRDGKAPEGPASGPIKICIDSKSDANMGFLGNRMAQSLCAQQSSSHNPDGSWSFTSTCQMGPAGTVKTTGMASGDFGSKYIVHTESDTTGSQIARLNGHHVTDMTATYDGPCPADMAAGDVLLPNGMKVNPEKMMSGARAASK